MNHYRLTKDAEQDLLDVARYTMKTWGKEVFHEYQKGLESLFNNLPSYLSRRLFSTKFPGLMVTKYRYHYIFYLVNEQTQPVIIGVIHEKRDLVKHLNERLELGE